MNSKWKNNAWDFLKWGALALVVVGAFWYITQQGPEGKDPGTPYKTFIDQVRAKQISKADLNGRIITGVKTNGEPFTSYIPAVGDNHLIDDLLANNVIFTSPPPPEPESIFMQLLISWGPMILLIGIWIIYMRRQQGAGRGGPMGGFGQNKAKLLEQDKLTVMFTDVAGCDEAKEEVAEMVDFLKDPVKYQKLGGKIPRGALMIGPPGTGKTLLARAIAGEAKVPFFTVSGSDFVQMYVGVGASRVRDMFEQGKAHAPCIIFIDEMDAVGRQRGGAGVGGGNDEREQTLNQLLVEMDGFEGNEGVIVIGATNRPDVLDKALLRPGRFDRQVTVGLPDVRGREQILVVHLKKVPLADDVEPKYIAQGTPGFSGADLANVVNEAALFAARANQKEVTMANLEKAKDKILMGAERHTMVMDPDELKVTAYHEAGHCIVGQMIPKHDPTYKVSIMPRGRALGITMFLPEKDEYSASKKKLDGKISSLYGGRIAEVIIGGEEEVTTGASNDIERATELARNMVTKWGLSTILGPLKYAEEEGKMFPSKMSPETEAKIEAEIRAVIDRNYERAETILKENIDILHSMAAALIKYETIDKGQIDDLMNRRPVRVPEGWDENNSRSSLAKKQVILEKGNSESIQGS